MACESLGSGAYLASSWMVTFERPSFWVSIFLTLPTETPEIRTSASSASCVALVKAALNR